MKLSPYTIAKNCTDINDVNVGLNELREYFNLCEINGTKPLVTAYKRLSKLLTKKDKL